MTKKEVTVTKYISEDGKEFHSEEQCLKHEAYEKYVRDNRLQTGVVWVVHNKRFGGSAEVYSSYDLALKSLSNVPEDKRDNWLMYFVDIDRRFWEEFRYDKR